jgi:membrane fusion protein (multidrug efflux system)
VKRLALLGLTLIALTGCPSDEKGKHGKHGKRGGGAAPAVATAPVIAQSVEERIVGHAALEAEAEVEVICRLEGKVREVLVEAGQSVKAGAVLARLDATRAKLLLEVALLGLEQAKNTLGRRQLMHDQGVGSAEELEQARTTLRQAELTLKQARLDEAEIDLRAPRAGVVVERSVAEGSTLRVGDVTFKIADREPLLARVRVPEAQAERVAVGQQARVSVEGRAGFLRGEVIRVAPRVDLESGTVVATVAIRAGTQAIRLNRFATIEIVVAARGNALTIPLDALAVRGREDQVLVVTGAKPGKRGVEGTAELRAVRVGVRQAGRIEIREGLVAGDQVIVAAPDDLRSGAKVRVLPAVSEGVAPAASRSRAGPKPQHGPPSPPSK